MKEQEHGVWSVVAGTKYIEAVREEEEFLFSCEEEEFQRIWSHYFDLGGDYAGYKKQVPSEDSYLREAIRCGWGVRILCQDLWEMLVTFILSQNNNIPRIKGSVTELCNKFGVERSGRGLVLFSDGTWNEVRKSYMTFPTPESIASSGISGLSGLGLGYRDKYILSIAECCSGPEGNTWLAGLKEADYESAHAQLLKQLGIGKKVADCVCLFGLHHVGAFPVDTHVKQILTTYYPDGFPLKRYEGYAGILQQYMFYHKINRLAVE
jgi:N-glycosylase/DNA lyase